MTTPAPHVNTAPSTAAAVTPSDVDVAVAAWRRDAPPALRDLLDALPAPAPAK